MAAEIATAQLSPDFGNFRIKSLKLNNIIYFIPGASKKKVGS